MEPNLLLSVERVQCYRYAVSCQCGWTDVLSDVEVVIAVENHRHVQVAA